VQLPAAAVEGELGAVVCMQHRDDLFGESLQIIAGGQELGSQCLHLGQAGEDDQVDTALGGVRVGCPSYPAEGTQKIIGTRLTDRLESGGVGTVSGRNLVKVGTRGRQL